MNAEIRDERFRKVVGEDVQVDQVGTGFEFTEGPVWNHVSRHLIFSDVAGNVMRKWTPDGRIEIFRQPSGMAGNYYDPQGRLVTCEHAGSRVTRTEHDGAITVLATHYEGRELNSPNDIIVKSDGAIYFTDPSFGRMEYYGVPRNQELHFQGVYRLDPEDGGLTLLASDFVQPNGLCFSLDESRLFVNDTAEGHVRAFDIGANGGLSDGHVWAEVTGEGQGSPDGMKLDSNGNLYTTGPGGLHVFTPDAACLGVIHVPEAPANFTWGEDDLLGLFITASTSLYRARVKTPGNSMF